MNNTISHESNNGSAVALVDDNSAFGVKDCAIIRRMGGVDAAINLRELRERLKTCPIESIYFHFCETLVRAGFDNPEYKNDFAIWAAESLRDLALAERIGIINPYSFNDFEHLRERLMEIIDERLSELNYYVTVPAGDEFIFLQAATVIFDTGIKLREPADILRRLPEMSCSTIYYHFLEARRRTTDRVDDFTFWLKFFDPVPEDIIAVLQSIDFYFMSLPELKQKMIDNLKGVI